MNINKINERKARQRLLGAKKNVYFYVVNVAFVFGLGECSR